MTKIPRASLKLNINPKHHAKNRTPKHTAKYINPSTPATARVNNKTIKKLFIPCLLLVNNRFRNIPINIHIIILIKEITI
jgi:hypothetical protein